MGNLILSQISEVGGEKQGNFYKRLYKNTKQKTFPRGKVFLSERKLAVLLRRDADLFGECADKAG